MLTILQEIILYNLSMIHAKFHMYYVFNFLLGYSLLKLHLDDTFFHATRDMQLGVSVSHLA